MNISHYRDAGYKCPHCNSKDLRCCYHDHQTLDSWVCNCCGLRWQEDTGNDDHPKKESDLPKYIEKMKDKGVFWVLHKRGNINPIMDSRSSDGVNFKDFGDHNKWSKSTKEYMRK